MIKQDYVYRAVVRSIYDGDTIRVDIDLGLSTWIKNTSLRLYGIDTPELRGEERPEGLKVRDWLLEQIPVGSEITIQTFKDKTGKYGRYLAMVWRDGKNLNRLMVELGLAKEYMV